MHRRSIASRVAAATIRIADCTHDPPPTPSTTARPSRRTRSGRESAGDASIVSASSAGGGGAEQLTKLWAGSGDEGGDQEGAMEAAKAELGHAIEGLRLHVLGALTEEAEAAVEDVADAAGEALDELELGDGADDIARLEQHLPPLRLRIR